MCPKLTGGTQFFAYTFGRPESLNKMAVNTMLHSIGVRGDMVEKLFTSMSDEEVVKQIVEQQVIAVPAVKIESQEDILKDIRNLLKKNIEKENIENSDKTEA